MQQNYRGLKDQTDKSLKINGFTVNIPNDLIDYVKLVGLSEHYLYDILNYYTNGQYPDDI